MYTFVYFSVVKIATHITDVNIFSTFQLKIIKKICEIDKSSFLDHILVILRVWAGFVGSFLRLLCKQARKQTFLMLEYRMGFCLLLL
jgi:hypothetical protein